MKILNKIKYFLQSEQKALIMDNLAMQLITRIKYRKKFMHLGKGCCIYKPDRAIGLSRLWVGDRVSILKHSRIEIMSHYGMQKFDSKIEIGERTSIGQNFHAVSVNYLKIGKNVTISGNVFLSNCNHEYREMGKHILKQPLLIDRTEIGDNCFIGYGAAILPGAVLGKQCIVGTNAVVRKGVYPDGCVLVGVPAKIVKKYNNETGMWEKTQDE